MRNLAIACVTVTLLSSGLAYAQDTLIGKYTGSVTYPGKRGDTQLGLELVIESIESGSVKATADYFTGGKCAGQYPMVGRYAGNKLQLKSTEKVGRAADCGLILNLAVEGNKLLGTTYGGHRVQLSK
jgi:hypothetical protein